MVFSRHIPFWAVAIALRCGFAPICSGQTTRPIVGAIRWDVWVGALARDQGFKHGLWNEQALASDKRFHDRIPFYGRVLPDGTVEARCVTQDVMDREIACAKGALDYWAFLDYPEWRGPGSAAMHTALKLYLSSRRKGDIGFCIILGNNEWWKHKDVCLGYLREPSYQAVLGSRPLVYYNLINVQSDEQLTRLQFLKRELADLAAQSLAQGTGDPYYVVMLFSPERASKACDMLGAQAVSSYAKPKRGAGESYASYARYVENTWNGYMNTGKPVVPICMTGWDQRPRAVAGDNPQWASIREKGPGWFQKGAPQEIAAHIGAAIEWNGSHPAAAPANAVIIYNWNEFTEGGWLCPTLGEGDARLRAIEALRQDKGW